MNEEKKNQDWQDQKIPEVPHQQQGHSLEAGIGAVTGGVAGAAIGGKLGGKTGAVLGAIAGAVAGGTAGDVVGESLEEQEHKAMEALGIAKGEDEILSHYSWSELQALSKPQVKQAYV